MNRNKRLEIANETVAILEKGFYPFNDKIVDIKKSIETSVSSTIHLKPDEFAALYQQRDTLLTDSEQHETIIEVVNETSLNAVARLYQQYGEVCCLNFASAKNPGGGFLGGSQAQEESLARSSALYASLNNVPAYYQTHRALRSGFYTDNMIYSPRVPVFRDDYANLLQAPYPCSFITSPAVNRGVVAEQETDKLHLVPTIMSERIEKVLSLAYVNQEKILVLGAWGCGVFRNKPEEIAQLFKRQLLENEMFIGRFKHIVFAVFDTKGTVFESFEKMLS